MRYHTQRGVRRAYVGVPLAAVLLGILLAWSIGGGTKAQAHFPHSGISFSVSGPGGCSSDGTGICYLGAGETFQIDWNVDAVPGGFTYYGYDTKLTYGGVTVNQVSLTQSGAGTWPDCSLTASQFTAGTVQVLCGIGIGASASSYTGPMWHINFQCPATPGVGQISIVHGLANTDLVDPSLVAHGEAASGNEDLLINCSSPTPTPEPPVAFAGTGTPGFNGDGTATTSLLNNPTGLSESATGDIYIADTANCLVRRVSGGNMTTVAGVVPNPSVHCGYTGEANDARTVQLNHPHDVVLDANGTDLYIADTDNCRIRKVANVTSVPPGPITTVLGGDCGASAGASRGSAASATIHPISVERDSSGATYALDKLSCQLLRNNTVVVGTGVCGSALGDGGPGIAAQLNQPNDFSLLDPTQFIVIADTGNNRVRLYDPATGIIHTIAGTGAAGSYGDGVPATLAQLNQPQALTTRDYRIYVADTGNKQIRRVNTLTHTITNVLATGSNGPVGISVAEDGTVLAYCTSASLCQQTGGGGTNPDDTRTGNFVPASGCGLTPGFATIDLALPSVLLGLIATRKRLGRFWRLFCSRFVPRTPAGRLPEASGP